MFIVKRGLFSVHLLRSGAGSSLCGISRALLLPGSKPYYWINQVGCKRCRRALAHSLGKSL